MARKKTEEKKDIRTRSAVGTRGKVFHGYVKKKFPMRVVVEFERTLYIRKYERFLKDKTRLHARVPQGMDVNVGDYVRIQECRPLSKIIHFIVTEIVKKAHTEEVKAK